MTKFNLPLSTMVAALVLAGCSTARPPEQLKLDLPTAYREQATALDGAWKLAAPADSKDRGAWWKVFGDDQLSELIVEAGKANLNLAIALARVKDALSLIHI